MSQTTVRAEVKGAVKSSGDYMHFKGVWWTTSRQASNDLWLAYQPDRRALFAYNSRAHDESVYSDQWMCDYGDVCEKWASLLDAGMLSSELKGTKKAGGMAFPDEDLVNGLFKRVRETDNF